jgi:hypothetical protein
MEDVVATDNGFVAAGLVWESDDDVVSNHPTIWTSPDGVDWSQAWQGDPVQETDGPQPGGYIGMLAVNPEGLIIAVGTAEDSVGEVVVAVWISTNGQDWERVETDSAAFTVTTGLPGVIPLLDPLDATWGPTGFVVVGFEASEGESSSSSGFNVAIWRSPDGRAWTRVDTTDQDFGTTGSLGSIAALGSGYVAAGPGLGPFEGPVTVWTSLDGSRWNRVLEVDGEYAQAIVVIDDATVIAGARYANDDFHAAVWAGPSFDPSTPPPQPAAVTTPTTVEEPSTDLNEGASCEELATLGDSYAQTVAYWMRYDMPADLDPDGNGLPCEDAYPASDVTDVYGGPEAMSVHIVSDLPAGTFLASGPAVDAGIVCPTGTQEFTDDNAAPPRQGAIGRWEDRYTCDDGSGTFIIGADVFVESGDAEYGVWNIVSGTGTYESLRAGGGSNTSPTGRGTWSDDMPGRLWFVTDEN